MGKLPCVLKPEVEELPNLLRIWIVLLEEQISNGRGLIYNELSYEGGCDSIKLFADIAGILKNSRSHTLKCSHYMPSPHPEDTPLPCVVYCHGNRADANEAAVVLLPLNITVFTLDFSGSGLSDGDYVSLGWHEKDDLRAVVSYLRSNKEVSRIGLWGRSMGAVTRSNVKMALQYMRRVIQKKAKFDIMDLNCAQGGKNMIKFSGDHNSSRPQLFYDSVSIFFYNTLYHPQRASSNCSNKLQMNSKLKDLKADTAIDESMLYEIISNLRIASIDAASSSSTSASFSTAKLADDAPPEIASVMGTLETNLGEDPTSPSDAHFQVIMMQMPVRVAVHIQALQERVGINVHP
ncbi:hypothetical protein V2J09_010225 [Rumex salicifolius]